MRGQTKGVPCHSVDGPLGWPGVTFLGLKRRAVMPSRYGFETDEDRARRAAEVEAEMERQRIAAAIDAMRAQTEHEFRAQMDREALDLFGTIIADVLNDYTQATISDSNSNEYMRYLKTIDGSGNSIWKFGISPITHEMMP